MTVRGHTSLLLNKRLLPSDPRAMPGQGQGRGVSLTFLNTSGSQLPKYTCGLLQQTSNPWVDLTMAPPSLRTPEVCPFLHSFLHVPPQHLTGK